MVIFVVVFNLIIALTNFWLAWQLGKLRGKLGQINVTLTQIERTINSVLARAPEFVARGQQGTSQLRQSYTKLELQLQQLAKILSLMQIGVKIGQRVLNAKNKPAMKMRLGGQKSRARVGQ